MLRSFKSIPANGKLAQFVRYASTKNTTLLSLVVDQVGTLLPSRPLN